MNNPELDENPEVHEGRWDEWVEKGRRQDKAFKRTANIVFALAAALIAAVGFGLQLR